MLSILYKLTLHKDLQNFVNKSCVFGQNVKIQKQQNKKSTKPMQESGIEPRTSRNRNGYVTSATPSQTSREGIVLLFCKTFTCMDNCILQFLIFTEVCFIAWLKCKMLTILTKDTGISSLKRHNSVEQTKSYLF